MYAIRSYYETIHKLTSSATIFRSVIQIQYQSMRSIFFVITSYSIHYTKLYDLFLQPHWLKILKGYYKSLLDVLGMHTQQEF